MIKKAFVVFSGVVIFSLLLSFAVLAEESSLPQAGVTPDSPLYFLKSWKESIQTFFTLGAENKAKQFLHLADVRLAEYQKMVEKGKTEIAEKTLQKYQDQLNRALNKVQETKDRGKDVQDVTERVKQATTKHLEVLQQNLQKAPEQAKKGIQKAIEASNAYQKTGGKLVITGTFSPKGVECRGFEGDDGVFYTLVSKDPASLKLMPPIDSSFRDGDRATIEGRLLKVSYCMQGATVLVEKIIQLNSDEKYCEQDSDCACGVKKDSKVTPPQKECFFGNKKYVDESQQCPDFCSGIDGTRRTKCINNQCKNVGKGETADWKTYKNEEAGYEFKYPVGWTVKTSPPPLGYLDVLLESPDFKESAPQGELGTTFLIAGFQFYVRHQFNMPNFQSLREFKKLGHGGGGPTKEIVVDGMPAIFEEGGYGFGLDLLTPNNVWVIAQLRSSNQSVDKSVSDRILSTFKFITDETAQKISVISPNGGEKWVMGKTYDIKFKWITEESKTIYINLLDYSQCENIGSPPACITPKSSLIASVVVNNLDKYSWTIPSSMVLGDKYKISIEDGHYSDESDDYFSIVSSDETADWKKIKLYYYNIKKDKEIAEYIPCSADAVLSVEREIPLTNTPIQGAIKLLIEGKLTEQEKSQGFQTEFPLLGFKLLNADLKDGKLILKFDDPNHATGGGSCRVNLLRHQIEKTAKQFSEVKEVKFEPEELFQP